MEEKSKTYPQWMLEDGSQQDQRLKTLRTLRKEQPEAPHIVTLQEKCNEYDEVKRYQQKQKAVIEKYKLQAIALQQELSTLNQSSEASEWKKQLYTLTAKVLDRDWPSSFNSNEEEASTYKEHSTFNSNFVNQLRPKKNKPLEDIDYEIEMNAWVEEIEKIYNPLARLNKLKAFYILKASLNLNFLNAKKT